MYCYYVIITFCYEVSKIQEKKIVKLMIVQVFDWLSKQVVYNFMYEWVWLCALIINTKPMSLI